MNQYIYITLIILGILAAIVLIFFLYLVFQIIKEEISLKKQSKEVDLHETV